MTASRTWVLRLAWSSSLVFGTTLGVPACSSLHRGAPPNQDPPVEQPTAPPRDEPTQIRVQISEEEQEELKKQIDGDLEIARTVIAGRPEAATLAEDQRQRWDTLQHYIDQTSAALQEGELRAASELALKARLLAEELRPD